MTGFLDRALSLAADVAWRRRFLLLVPFLISLPVAFVAALLAPSRYEAGIALFVRDPAKLGPHLQDFVISGSSSPSELYDAMVDLAVLARSEMVVTKALQDVSELP